MARQSKQSIAATSEGLKRANVALQQVCSGKKTILKDFAGISRARVQDFFAGKPIGIETFQTICKALEIEDWQNIAGLTKTINPQPEQRSQESGLGIDVLVREVRSHCCEAILDSYSRIRLPDDTRIDVDLLYVDVYVLENLSSKRYASISGLLEGVEQREDYERLALGRRQKRLPGQEIVGQFPRLMVLGKPGSGKTTFLRHLAIDCSKGKFFCDRIPVLIELRSIKEGNSFNLLNLIHREFGLARQEQTQQILNQGKAFILLDGLDEVVSQLRQSVRDQIYEFAIGYRKNRLVLTCRTQTIEYIADHFEPIEVANFDAQQVKLFARNWFTANPETSREAERWTSRFVRKLEENKQIRELAVTPILLTLTCLLFTAEHDLPTKRSELYEKGITLLLKQWDRFREIHREYQPLSVSAKQKLLGYLAFRKFEQPDNFILFKQNEIQGYIAEHLGIDAEESEALLEALEAHHGLLIEIANGIWSFSHLTFQEYFAARHIVDSPTPEAAFQHMVTHVTESHWREVFLLTVEMLPIADNLLQLMKREIDSFIATDEKLQQFLAWVHKKSQDVEALYKSVTSRAFYLDLTRNCLRNPTLTQSLAYKRDPMCTDFLAFVQNPDTRRILNINLKKLGNNPIYSHKLTQIFSHYRKSPLLCDLALTNALNLALRIDYNYTPASHSPFTFSDSDVHTYVRTLVRTLDIDHDLDSVLRLKLQELRDQLADASDNYQENLVLWWRENGQSWTERLREVMINCRNIGHDWQFSEEYKEQLTRYYEANKLLVDCLNIDCNVSPKVKQEIEETLLLPIAEIEKFKQRAW